MDQIDALRQEYIDHIASATKTSGKSMKVPLRDTFKNLAEMPDGEWGSSEASNPYAYNYVIEDGMQRMWMVFEPAYVSYRKDKFGSQNKDIPNNEMIISSSYRNPQRNEEFSTAQGSMHMSGRALDIKFAGGLARPSDERGLLFGSLWEMAEGVPGIPASDTSPEVPAILSVGTKAGGDKWFLELKGVIQLKNGQPANENNDGIPDIARKVDHFHIQDNY